MSKHKGSRSRLRGARQLELFPHEALTACAAGPNRPRTNEGDVALQEVTDDDSPRGDAADGGRAFQLVAVWHDRLWEPLRMFRRADGATVLVFRIQAEAEPAVPTAIP